MSEGKGKNYQAERDSSIWIGSWLAFLYAIVLIMVLLGGITRLTGSGLSIVDWRPVTGMIPPLSEQDWQVEFGKYKTSPEFRILNQQLDLHGFKKIFFWEYLHRLVGRILGLFLVIPSLILFITKTGEKWLRQRALALISLVLAQGLMGWLMVKSGLVSKPEVSHFRLAAHFLLAVATLSLILWSWLENKFGRARKKISLSSFLIGALLVVQMLYGAFLAGTKAGRAFPTFPTMNGQWFPAGAWGLEPAALNLVESPFFIHWFHRVLATMILIFTALVTARSRHNASSRFWAAQLLFFAIAQYGLGIANVLLQVPVGLGVAHQFFAILLFSSWLAMAYFQASRALATGAGYST